MTKWFGGLSQRHAGTTRSPVPSTARMLWDGGMSLWLAGQWRADEIRLVEMPGRRLAVLGICGASQVQLESALLRSKSTTVDSCMLSWPGSYHVVLNDADGTAAYGDLAGARPVYYIDGADGVRFASSAFALVESPGAPVDWGWLGVRLLCQSGPELLGGRSPFADVAAVEPGHALLLSRTGYRCERAWLPSPGRLTLDGGAEALSTALISGVAARVAGAAQPTSDLSGGLDSSTITWLTASALGEGRRVPALTLIERIPGNDDLQFARMLAGRHRLIEHHVVAVSHHGLPYSGLADVPLTDEPAPVAPTYARFRLWMDAVRQLGSDCHLTGHGGDAVLLAPPAYLADLRRGLDLIRHCMAWARLRQRAPRALMVAARATAVTSQTQALRQLSKLILAAGAAPTPGVFEQRISWFPSIAPVHWFTSEARDLVADEIRKAAEECGASEGGIGDQLALAELHRLARGSRTDNHLANELSVQLHDPFLDNTVVQACMDVAAVDRTSPFVPKPLLRQAFNDLVPAVVLDRRTKGNYTASLHQGVRRNTTALHELLAGSLLVREGILNMPAVCRAIDDAIWQPIPFGSLDTVIATELWLQALDSSRRSAPAHQTGKVFPICIA